MGLALMLAACGGATKSDEAAAKDAGASSAAPASSAASGSTPSKIPAEVRRCEQEREPKGACTADDRCAYTEVTGPALCDQNPTAQIYPIYDSKPLCECLGGAWTCHGTVTIGLAVGSCPSKTLPQRSACAKGNSCTAVCAANEECFTPVGCGLTGDIDGGFACGRNGDDEERGDDTCHRKCDTSSECPMGEDCFHVLFLGCQDYNGYPNGKGICCAANEHCQ